MIFERFNIVGASQNYINGVTYFNHNPQVIEGKGKFVTFDAATEIIFGGEELLETPLTTYQVYDKIPTSNVAYMPKELFLEVGERIVITTLNSVTRKLTVIHHDKAPKQESQSQAQAYTFTGNVTPV